MKVHGSELKHGVSAENAVQAAEWSLWIEPLDDDELPAENCVWASTPRPACWRPAYSSSKRATRWSSTQMPARRKYLDLLP